MHVICSYSFVVNDFYIVASLFDFYIFFLHVLYSTEHYYIQMNSLHILVLSLTTGIEKCN